MVIEGIDALAAFIAEMGLPTTFAELGADSSDETLRAVADTAVLMPTCTKPLTRRRDLRYPRRVPLDSIGRAEPVSHPAQRAQNPLNASRTE